MYSKKLTSFVEGLRPPAKEVDLLGLVKEAGWKSEKRVGYTPGTFILRVFPSSAGYWEYYMKSSGRSTVEWSEKVEDGRLIFHPAVRSAGGAPACNDDYPENSVFPLLRKKFGEPEFRLPEEIVPMPVPAWVNLESRESYPECWVGSLSCFRSEAREMMEEFIEELKKLL